MSNLPTQTSRRRLYYWLFVFAIIIRLFLHYKTDLIPGLNGGYYLVQLRSVIESHQLGFADMPLYFYILAGITQALMFLTSLPLEVVSVHVVKITDALWLPLSLIPIYYLLELIKYRPVSLFYEGILLLLALCSFGPLIFLGDFQKNAFAIPFLFSCLLFGYRFLIYKKWEDLILMGLFFGLISISHFGVLVFSMLFIGMGLMVYKGFRSVIWIALLSGITILITAIFDPARANRLLNIAGELFDMPAIFMMGPPELFSYLVSYIILFFGYKFYFKNKDQLTSVQQTAILSSLILVSVLAIPIINGDYARRMTLMLFVPQLIILSFLLSTEKLWPKRLLTILVGGSALFTVLAMIFLKQPSISSEAFGELEILSHHIEDEEQTLVIAKHGLEWWVNWQTKAKIANEHALNEELFDQYPTIYFVEEKVLAERRMPPKGPFGFPNPKPTTGELIQVEETNHFIYYQWLLEN